MRGLVARLRVFERVRDRVDVPELAARRQFRPPSRCRRRAGRRCRAGGRSCTPATRPAAWRIRACWSSPSPYRIELLAVEQDVADEVGFLLVLLDGVALGPAVALPVDVADVVAGDVLAVLDELDGEARGTGSCGRRRAGPRRPAGPSGRGLRRGRGRRVEVSRHVVVPIAMVHRSDGSQASLAAPCDIASTGERRKSLHAATALAAVFTSIAITSSTVTPSLWAVKFRMSRCRRIGVGDGDHVVAGDVVAAAQHARGPWRPGSGSCSRAGRRPRSATC